MDRPAVVYDVLTLLLYTGVVLGMGASLLRARQRRSEADAARRALETRAHRAERRLARMLRLTKGRSRRRGRRDGPGSHGRLVPRETSTPDDELRDGDGTARGRTEKALLASEEQFRATFENAAVGMAVSASGGVLVECNEKLCEILGYARDEIVGRTFTDFGTQADAPAELARHRAFLRGELATFTRDKQYVKKDGSILWASVSASVLRRDARGNITHVLAILQDISARKTLEQDLLKVNELLELGIHGSDLSIFTVDLPDGTLERSTFTLFNFWEQLGYGVAERPRDFASAVRLVLAPEERESVQRAIAEYLNGVVPRFDIEHHVLRKDGTVKWVLARGAAVRDAEGRAIRFIGSHVDITRRKQVEERLRESEYRWRSLTEALPQLIWTARADGTLEYLSAQACEYTGLDEAELLADGWANAMHPDDVAETARSWMDAVARQVPHEVQHRLRRRDGEYRWFTTRAEPARDSEGRVFKWVGSSTDITALKTVEADLRRAKELLDLGVRGSKVGIFELDMPDGALETARQTMINLWETLGYDDAAVAAGAVPRTLLAAHPDDVARVERDIQRYLRRQSADFEVEYRAQHKDGAVLWRLARGTAVWAPDGTPTRFLGSFFDITDNKRIEARLRESEQRWRVIAETLPQLIWTSNAEGRGDYFSTQTETFTGVSEAELIGAGGLSVVHPDDRERTAEVWWAAVRAESLFEVDFRIRRADGVYRWVTTRATPLRDESGRVFKWFGTCTDIEEGKQLAEELRHAKERLELAVTSSNLSIWEYELTNGEIAEAHHKYTNLWESLGYDGEVDGPSALGHPRDVVVHPDDLPALLAANRACIAGETDAYENESRILHKDGTYRWRLSRGKAIRDEHGVPKRFIGTSVDITDKKLVEAQLRESEQRWRNLAETLPQFVLTTGPDGRADYFSRRTTDYTGKSLDELLTDDWGGVIHPDDFAYTRRAWTSAVEHQRSHEVEHRIRRWDGEYRWFITRAEAVRDSGGKIFKWFGTSTDVTKLKELETELRRAKERLEVAIRSSNLSIWEYDLGDGTLGSATQTLTNVWESLGYDPLEAPPSMEAVVHPDDLPRVATAVRTYLEGETASFETEHRVRHHDGSYRWVLGRGVALRDPATVAVRFVGTSVDITEIKRIEGDLQRAREAAETANRAKDEFLANVSHEIRTPMNAILGMTELALDSARSDPQKQLLTTVKSAAKSLLGIINDLLDFSKISAGKLALDEADFRLRAEVGDALRALAPRAHRKGLDLRCHVHPTVPDALFGDAGRLRQVLMNLVGNALKFTARGEVVVEVQSDGDGSAGGPGAQVTLAFSIRDTGVGIARDKQAAVFRAFEQEDSSTTRRYGGTGLGLTISAQLAELMGGTITVDSEPGRGSTFTVTARFALSTGEQPGPSSPEPLEGARVPAAFETSPSAPAPARPLRILVAEDNELNAALLRTLLGKRGHHAHVVEDGRAAITRAAASSFDLMLLDVHMPEMDGFEVVRAVRAREEATGERLPIIALTARSSHRDRERCLAAGMDDFLAKPIEADALWAAVDRVAAARPEPPSPPSRLLDARAVLRACAGESEIFDGLRDAFLRALPEHLVKVESALRDRDLPGLAEAAHKLSGTLGAFSTVAGAAAGAVEEAARRDDVASCDALVKELAATADALLAETRALRFADLTS